MFTQLGLFCQQQSSFVGANNGHGMNSVPHFSMDGFRRSSQHPCKCCSVSKVPFSMPKIEGLYQEDSWKEATELARQLVLQSMSPPLSPVCPTQPDYSLLQLISTVHWSRVQLSDTRGMVLQFSLSRDGSMFLQHKLSNQCSEHEMEMLFQEAMLHFNDIVNDKFGNYVFQKLLELGTERHRHQLADALLHNMPFFAGQHFAGRVLQKALDYQSLQPRLCSALLPLAPSLITDFNGNHVVQKAFSNEHFLKCVVMSLLEHPEAIVQMSMHESGYRVIQTALKRSNAFQRCQMIGTIHGRLLEVSTHPHGNFVIQTIIEMGSEEYLRHIIRDISCNLLQYATNKFSSNIVEKCLQIDAFRPILIRSALHSSGNTPILVEMMKDKYGNYPAQALFKVATREQRSQLFTTLLPFIGILSKYVHGNETLLNIHTFFDLRF